MARGLAIAFTLFGFLPIANWIANGHSAPWYADVLQTWLSGTAIVAGVAVVLVLLSRRRALDFAVRIAQVCSRWFAHRPLKSAALIALVSAVLYASIALLVFDGRPLFIDEVVQLYQARVFAAGRLTDPVGPFAEFFGALNVVTSGDRQFGQFPPGGPAHLLLGVLIGVPWLITPLIGACAVFVFALLVRRIESDPGVALGATLLLAFSPFMLFMSASHMNHAPTLLWILVAWLAWSHLTSDSGSRWRWAFLFGLAAAVALTVRPVDAVAMTAPALLLWLTKSGEHEDRPRVFGMMCLGALVPLAVLLGFNQATTGSPVLFGYEAIWGKTHGLGFHDSPWGAPHTPARGLELLNLYALRLQSYLFETPTPSLIPIIATLIMTKRASRFDQAMLWSIAIMSVAYFAYWHDGFYLGPRFFFVLVPALALLAARAPRAFGQASKPHLRHYAFFALATSVLIGLATGVPERARVYAQSLRNSRPSAASEVDSLGIRNALIFVRESWGAQVLARLWGRGIERTDAELLYRAVDTCVLDSVLTRLEHDRAIGLAARAQLWPLLADSSLVQPSNVSPDRTERISHQPYSQHCMQHVMEDRRGTALYPLVLAEDHGSNVYARDLGTRNAILIERYPERRAFLLLPRAADDPRYVVQPLVLSSIHQTPISLAR